MTLAAVTNETLGWTIFIVILVGVIAYTVINILRGAKPELGSEIELAANRKPYLDDEELEGKKLDRALTWGLVTLFIIAIGLPLYWIYEPGRQANAESDFNRKFVTGVTVVTTTDAGGRPRGLAVNAYTSVSLDPPLVLVCVQKSSWTHPALFESRHLGVNILANTQRHVVERFSSKVSDKFAGLDWHAGPAGSPLLDGSAARGGLRARADDLQGRPVLRRRGPPGPVTERLGRRWTPRL